MKFGKKPKVQLKVKASKDLRARIDEEIRADKARKLRKQNGNSL